MFNFIYILFYIEKIDFLWGLGIGDLGIGDW
jgi:hypothetical protein